MAPTSFKHPLLSNFTLKRDNGSIIYFYLEPIKKAAARVYALFKADKSGDNFFNHLSIPGETGDNLPGLYSASRKNFLGELIFRDENAGSWDYNGNQLSAAEQQQIANCLQGALQ